MASTGKCEYCGSTVRSDEQNCPNCGAANPNYVVDTERTVFLPKTIGELSEYCAERGMPLLRMRFFIGQNFKEPRAFGIYRDGKNVVVYKNKADGTRAIRYKGPDEAHAVNEIFMKMMEECHKRGIYPDGKPVEQSATGTPKGKKKFGVGRIIPIVACLIVILIILSILEHRNDGYYQFDDSRIYYKNGTSWYCSDVDSYDGWYSCSGAPAEDIDSYYLAEEFDSDWGASDFEQSSTWRSIHESHSSSSDDYDDWDSGDTDWDSDW